MQPLLQWKSNKYYIFLVCVCSLRYPARNAHAPYYIAIRDLSRSTLFPTLSHTLHDSRGGGILNIECVLIFSIIIV